MWNHVIKDYLITIISAFLQTAIQSFKIPMTFYSYVVPMPVSFILGDGMKEHLKHVGENIRAARKSKNLTIDNLSELIGISPSFLGTLERGESSLSVETLINVCEVLGVSSDSIILGRNVTPSPTVE